MYSLTVNPALPVFSSDRNLETADSMLITNSSIRVHRYAKVRRLDWIRPSIAIP